jgi:WD repeat and SOF domain-containing protein 1
MRSNKLAWNPREPFNFILANEDANVYQFDMRKLDKALMIHKDHVSAVMDVAFSPTGREFATGGYDRTLRLFNTNGPRSREVYHTKRMQRIFSVNFSTDAKFVLTGSDDTNIRLWKAKASESLGVNPGRQERKQQLNNAIQKRYSHMPEVKRISKHKLEPKYIKKAATIAHIQSDSQRKKQDNRKRHTSKDDGTLEPLRKRAVLREYE